jgi:hypothetical protein
VQETIVASCPALLVWLLISNTAVAQDILSISGTVARIGRTSRSGELVWLQRA